MIIFNKNEMTDFKRIHEKWLFFIVRYGYGHGCKCELNVDSVYGHGYGHRSMGSLL